MSSVSSIIYLHVYACHNYIAVVKSRDFLKHLVVLICAGILVFYGIQEFKSSISKQPEHFPTKRLNIVQHCHLNSFKCALYSFVVLTFMVACIDLY